MVGWPEPTGTATMGKPQERLTIGSDARYGTGDALKERIRLLPILAMSHWASDKNEIENLSMIGTRTK
jgi:hypothetical protein